MLSTDRDTPAPGRSATQTQSGRARRATAARPSAGGGPPRRAAGLPRRAPYEKIETMTYSLAAISLMSIAMLNAQEVTRGVGVYPGDPHQDFSPAMVVESSSYRNLAFRRPAYHSSSYDYNLTAQLVTDGIEAKEPPRWVSIATSQAGVLPKNQRDYLLEPATR